MFSEQKAALLEEERVSSPGQSSRSSSDQHAYILPARQKRSKWPFIHIFVLSAYTALFVFAYSYLKRSQDHFGGVEQIYSPANEHLQYYIREPMDHNARNPFYGEPSKEMDDAWMEVFKGTIVSVTGDDLKKANVTSFRIAGDEEHYGATLGMYHDLHCLKRIKQWIYPEYYYADTPKEQMDLLYEHMLHCFEVIRMSLTCHPDTSLVGYDPKELSARGTPETLGGATRCVNFDALYQWTMDNSPADPINAYRNSIDNPKSPNYIPS